MMQNAHLVPVASLPQSPSMIEDMQQALEEAAAEVSMGGGDDEAPKVRAVRKTSIDGQPHSNCK